MTAVDIDALADLEEQRRFLLQSLKDLDRERDAGDIDEDDYCTLKDDYTARAAAVLHAIDQGKTGLAEGGRRLLAEDEHLLVGLVAGVVGERVAARLASGEPHLDLVSRDGARHGAAQDVVVDARPAVARAAAELLGRGLVLAAAVDPPVQRHGAELALGVDLHRLRIAVGDRERRRHEIGRGVAQVRLEVRRVIGRAAQVE